MRAYLFTYFKDETHSIYFATSTDGYTFTDVNGGDPVFLGKDLGEQKGVRDPHLMRGPDNAFYLSMTDLHISSAGGAKCRSRGGGAARRRAAACR